MDSGTSGPNRRARWVPVIGGATMYVVLFSAIHFRMLWKTGTFFSAVAGDWLDEAFYMISQPGLILGFAFATLLSGNVHDSSQYVVEIGGLVSNSILWAVTAYGVWRFLQQWTQNGR